LRLTHLKLAGFKSFVDPTTVHLHGQRVGVVGPNGCGKSNVMESVRWVLGESSAKEMRADAMDAVIFNGSANRKPISRASVELIFDNSLGGATGEWSQYAEISVKRVIEREKGSSYFINNTPVRRRDVADLFLGTGLGGRAYAIIGQNTISRIVEAKPEELRIFLEEAAGISKYKDRRRETELRLRDTRENLTRVEDICRELQKQINRLASQAVVAEKYHQLQSTLKHAEGQLWLLKKRDASADWEACKMQVERLVNQLEAQVASLRAAETQLETTRQLHYAASEGINVAQASYYEANAEVSNLEHQLKQTHEARERMSLQLQQVQSALERNAQVLIDLQQQLAAQNSELALAEANALSASEVLQRLSQGLPEKDASLKQSSEHANASQHALMQAKQRIQIEQNNLQHQVQLLQETQQRITRYQAELSALNVPQAADLTTIEAECLGHQQRLSAQELTLHQLRDAESFALADIQQLRSAQTLAQQALSQSEAEIRSLVKLQQSVNQASTLADWLKKAGLDGDARLWQQIEVTSGWNTALEAVLGARLNALITAKNPSHPRPPSAVVLGLMRNTSSKPNSKPGFHPLLSMIACKAEALYGVLQDWLAGVYVLTDADDADVLLGQLLPGECLVNLHGDIYTPHSVSFYGSGQNAMQGVLERQQQLTILNDELPALKNKLDEVSHALLQKESDLQSLRSQQQTLSHVIKQITSDMHALQMQVNKIKQAHEVSRQRQASIQQEIANAEERLQILLQAKQGHEAQLAQLTLSLPTLEAAEEASRTAKLQAEKTYFALRDELQAAEKVHQERLFSKKLIINAINELNNKIKVNFEEKAAYLQRQSEAENTLKLTPMDTLKANLTHALNQKQLAEQALANARNQLAEQDNVLQQQERERLQQEQQLHPLRDALEQSRLREQEARLHFEHCMAGLAENGLEEAVLAEGLTAQIKASELANKTMQLQREMTALGAVNLAAIQELATEQARKVYLDSQMRDLTEASNTLEEAIRKIDKETRGKLQATYDEANRNFNELFNVLFGGGQARLELLGDEILDTGIQVFAQPPGKKNSTIQLLSGGEKALTAMALVFALFRLNPAPFCLMDEVDAPLDDSNTERFCSLVKKMSEKTQFLFVSHNKVTMEMAQQLIGVTMQESGVSRIVDVDIDAAMQMQTA
jgi:chromosome segregation protein